MGLHFRPVNFTVNTTKYQLIIMRLFVNNSQGLVAVSRSKPVDDDNGKYTQVSGQNSNDGRYRAPDDGRYHPSSQQEGISALQLCFYPTVPNACWSRRNAHTLKQNTLTTVVSNCVQFQHILTHTHTLTNTYAFAKCICICACTDNDYDNPAEYLYLYCW